MSLQGEIYERRLVWRHRLGQAFEWLCRLATWCSLGILAILLLAIGQQAWGWFDVGFLTRGNSYMAAEAGIMAGLWGSLWLIGLTAVMSVPLGVGAAVYLEEYAKPTRLTKLIQLNISNLAGVPSIVYGILGFTVFVRMFGLRDRPEKFVCSLGFADVAFELPLGRVVLSGAATLTLLSLPVVIIAAQEALRSVPASLRHASLALGATKWQTVRHQVLPAALPGILTGVILALSRALADGSTAVGLFNHGDDAAQFSVTWAALGLGGKQLEARDLWAHQSISVSGPQFMVPVPKHGVMLLKVRAK